MILNQSDIIARFKNTHKDRYCYKDLRYSKYNTKVKIKCKLHGYFLQTPKNHISGKGCPKCSRKISRDKKDWINLFKEIHGSVYDYSEIKLKTSRDKVKIKCKDHGYFLQSPSHHYRGQGCPKCNSLNQMSAGERQIQDYLNKNNISFLLQYRFNDCRNPKTNKKLPFDFYLNDYNILIEYDGEFHFYEIKKFCTKLVDIKYRDNIKTKYALDNNIKLIRIPFYHKSRIIDILDYNIN